jgi:hypothetical protein
MVDRRDVGAVVDEIYAMISGPAGPRDWARQRAIFHPEARQVRTWIGAAGRPEMKMMSPAEYEADTTPFFAANAFYEVEIARRVDIFGNIAHVWSAYEARRSPDDAQPERRGINSIQLVKDGDGLWSVLAMVWDNEREGVSIGDGFAF